MLTIDLNCDLGESFGQYELGKDEEIIKYVSSVNIACGFHAADPVVINKTVKYALDHGVGLGAHPSYPDLVGFGRRPMEVSFEEAKMDVIYQVGAVKAFAEAHGGKLQHVKPHGALYNKSASDSVIARAIAEAVYAVDKDLIVMGLIGGELIKAAKEIGLRTAGEAFADRAYNNEGQLVDRREENSVITDVDQALAQMLSIAKDRQVKTIDGKMIPLEADSICVHGDNAETIRLVQQIREALKIANVTVQSFAK